MRSFKTTTGILFATAILLTACGGADKKGDGNKDSVTGTTVSQSSGDNGAATKLEGTWVIKRAEGAMDSLNIGTEYEFKGSKLSFGKGSYKNPGNTQVTDSTFSFQAEGNELKFMYNYKFNGDTLVVEMQNSGGQVFHMVKGN